MLDYSLGQGPYENWILADRDPSALHLGKTETIMLLGNGYLGIRSAAEEPYIEETRNLFINGTFNQGGENEVTELPNAADATRLDIRIDGKRFSLEFGDTRDYIKQLNLKDAELIRSFIWISPEGKELRFCFRRFASLDNPHLIGMKVEVESMSDAVHLSIDSGIDGRMSNSGVQHFLEGDHRIIGERFLQLTQTTAQSRIDFVHNAVHTLTLNGGAFNGRTDKDIDRRRVWKTFDIDLNPNDRFEMQKLITVHTTRDSEYASEPKGLQQLQERSLRELKKHEAKGYQKLVESHRLAWLERVWDKYRFEVESENPVDGLALRFSLYHLTAMAPAHDERLGIGAKALSGEAYKGHSFWDTEIFILPFFIFSDPELAKSLLLYRYQGLPSARQKAKEFGYTGAMYPWEMAGPEDGEVTPVWGGIDIVTGERTKIWAGLIEHHLSADIAFAVYQYVNATGDEDFLRHYGYEMVFETARFWASRLEWNDTRKQFEITDVIGPDEYKEHVDNNLFTNYMAYFNLKLAMRYSEELKKNDPELWASFGAEGDYSEWKSKADGIYLAEPREGDLVLPQDDTYLDLPDIDLEKYKQQTKARTIYRDYNPEQVNGFQVTKQADVVLLFYLMEQTFLKEDHRFTAQVKRANFFYYEARTLHDSSLSLTTHAIIANDIGEYAYAYELFQKACAIDMGPNMNSSSDGIHAAAIGGIWKAAVFGFAGVRQADDVLKIEPRLPAEWRRMQFRIYWRGQLLQFNITKDRLKVTAEGDQPVAFECGGTLHEFKEAIEIPLVDY